MKANKIITAALVATLCTAGFTSCGDDYDDTAIKGQIENLDKRVTALEDQVKSDIAGIQAAIATLQGNDFVTGVKALADESGYEITFSKSGKVTVKNGVNGKDGVNGENGKDGKTPVITAKPDDTGNYYWYVNGEPLTEGGTPVPASITPKITAAQKPDQTADKKYYWMINGEFMDDGNGGYVPATGEAGPVNFTAEPNEDGTITFSFGEENYTVNIAKGELTIVGDNADGRIIIDVATEYTVALPQGWNTGDVDAIRADVASTSATGVAITRAASWTVTSAKNADGSAKITVTGTEIPQNEVAELTVTFVKKTGERLVGSTFLTAWKKNSTDQQEIEITKGGEIAAAITAANAAHMAYTKFKTTGEVALSSADWEALKTYPYLEELEIAGTNSTIPANAFEGHKALSSVVLTGSAIETIPASAFKGCIALATFTGVAEITEIEASAFEGCAKLTTLDAVTGVTTIGANAFNGCAALTTMPTFATVTEYPEGVFASSGLTTVTIPAEITAIKAKAFANCALTTVTFSATFDDLSVIAEDAFADGTGEKPTLTFVEGQDVDLYKGEEWKGTTWASVIIGNEEQGERPATPTPTE